MTRLPKSRRVAAAAALTVAWGGPALLVNPAHPLFGSATTLSKLMLYEIALWCFLATVIAIVWFWEKQPLSSIGLRPFRWLSFVWAGVLVITTVFVVVPLQTWAVHGLGLPELQTRLAQVRDLPLSFRVVAVVTAGIVEDVLFLGYTVERVAAFTRNYVLAGSLAVTASTVLHMFSWGIAGIGFVVPLAVGAAFFIWKRDLLANIMSHVTCDALGLVVIPLLPHH